MVSKPFESKIQDIVYNVDVGIGLRLIKAGLYLLFLLALTVVYTATQFRGLTSPEAMDYAQVGRNIALKGGFTTEYIRPVSMWYLIEHSPSHDPMIQDHPDIVHAPLYPLLLAAGFKSLESAFMSDKPTSTYPPEQWVIVPFGHLCTILTGLFLFLIGRRLFDQRVAMLGTTMYFLSDSVWAASISGTPLSLATLLTVLAFYALLTAAANRTDGRPFSACLIPYLLCALFCILAFLTRYALAVLVPAVLLFIVWSFRENRYRWAVGFVLIFLVGISPWLIRNVNVSGGILGLAPLLAFNGNDPVTGSLFERTFLQTPDLGPKLHQLQIKWLTNMAGLLSGDILTLGDGILASLFITTFLYNFSRDHVRRLRWCIALAMLLLMVVGACFGPVTTNLLHIFWPFAILYGLSFFFILLERLQIRIPIARLAIIVAVVALGALPLLFTLLPPRAAPPYPPYFPPYITHVCRMIKAEELLATDMPWATAWYGDRNSLALPASIDDFYEINDYTKRISGIYFTTITRDREYVRTLLTGEYRTWFPLLEGRIPSDFPLTQGFPLNNLDQLFLTDRPRWLEK